NHICVPRACWMRQRNTGVLRCAQDDGEKQATTTANATATATAKAKAKAKATAKATATATARADSLRE
ncbi:MAG: hypothetical protein ABI147_05290, partial [Acidobacteriaceae bacterium]